MHSLAVEQADLDPQLPCYPVCCHSLLRTEYSTSATPRDTRPRQAGNDAVVRADDAPGRRVGDSRGKLPKTQPASLASVTENRGPERVCLYHASPSSFSVPTFDGVTLQHPEEVAGGIQAGKKIDGIDRGSKPQTVGTGEKLDSATEGSQGSLTPSLPVPALKLDGLVFGHEKRKSRQEGWKEMR